MHKQRFDTLQIFRGWAALLVVLVHASGITYDKYGTGFFGNYFAMGNAGVDFFFVLSGFLISFIHLKDVGFPRQLFPYLVKRLVRIYPIYWLVTLLILPVYLVVPSYGQGDETNISVIIGSLTLFPISRAPILVAGWTLRHEMLFYCVFALLIGVSSVWSRAVVMAWAGGVFAAAVVAFNSPLHFGSPILQLFFWPQNLEFLFGCGAAILVVSASARQFYASNAWCLSVAWIGIVIFLFAGCLPDEYRDIKLGKHVFTYGIISTIIVIGATFPRRIAGSNNVWYRSRPYQTMHYIGDASYSIYLVHGPCLSMMFKVMATRANQTSFGIIPITWAILLFTVAIGCAFHAFVEKPLLKGLRRNLIPK